MRKLRFVQVLGDEAVVVGDETSIFETSRSFPLTYEKFFVLDRVPLNEPKINQEQKRSESLKF